MLPRAEAVSILAVTIEQTDVAFWHDDAYAEMSSQSSVIVAKVQAVPKKFVCVHLFSRRSRSNGSSSYFLSSKLRIAAVGNRRAATGN